MPHRNPHTKREDREGCPCTTGHNSFDEMTLAELSAQQRRPYQEDGHLVLETDSHQFRVGDA
jgi:hypothetical protein